MFCFANCLFKGFHVHLKDQKWSYAIEVCLKHLAYGFCVTNYQDMHTMKSLIAQTCQAFFPVVLVCPFQVRVLLQYVQVMNLHLFIRYIRKL